MKLPRRLRINPQARTGNVLKHVKYPKIFLTCFSRFPVSTADFSRWLTRAAIILHAGQLITWTEDGIPQVMDTSGNFVNWEAGS